MTAPTQRELHDKFERATRIVAVDELRPVMPEFGRGIVAAVTGNTASVRKGDAETEPTGGFTVPPGLGVVVGDLVFYFESGAERVILTVLSRNSPTSLSGHARVVNSGTVSTAALTGPGGTSVAVNIETGLTYVPAYLVWHTGPDGTWYPVPNFVNNEAGQLLDNFRCRVAVFNTNQTRLRVSAFTTRPEGLAAQTFRWAIMNWSIG